MTYKNKIWLLLGGTLLFFIVVYHMAIKQTVNEYSRSSQLEQQLEVAGSSRSSIQAYEQKRDELKAIVGQWQGTESRGNSILDFVSNQCDSLKLLLREFPPAYENEFEDNVVETQKIVLQGNFTPLVRILDNIENSGGLGRVASVNFQKLRDRKTRKIILTAEIYLQVVKQKNTSDENS